MLSIDHVLVEAAQKSGKLIEHNEELHYSRFREDFHQIPRGTVLLKDRVLFGFPHLPRIFRLKEGIEKNMPAPFYVEEKIDGFNLRIAQIEGSELPSSSNKSDFLDVNGSIYAFSRGGFLDPFATEKAREARLEKFFANYPNYALCAEMLGNTPYTPPTRKFDVAFFVFDVDDGAGNYLPCEEKYRLLKKYGIPSVPVYGKFTDSQPVERIARNILKGKKEGLVLKSADRTRAVKFVTPFADIEDIHRNIGLLFDMPTGFFLQRVLRSAIFMKDFDLAQKEYGQQLGQAFYEGLHGMLAQVEREGEASEEFEIKIRDRAIWGRVLRHTSREVKIEKIFEREEGPYTRIRFKKIYRKTTRELRDALRGKAQID